MPDLSRVDRAPTLLFAAFLTVATTTCGGDGSSNHPPNGEPALRDARLSCRFKAGDLPATTVGATIDDFGTTPDGLPIQYVFVLMMENRSFDNYFGSFREYLLRVPSGTGARIAPQTPLQLDVPDPRTFPYDAKTQSGGVDVPPTAYDRRDPHDQDAQDAILVPMPGQDVAPFNPTVAGITPSARCDKHYWHHANDVLDAFGRFRQNPDPKGAEQCVADTCHEWWCSHMQWDGGLMDGFFQSNDGYYEGGESKSGFPPNAPRLSGDRAMLYYDWTDIPVYYWLADNFALADHYHSSLLGPTFPNRDYLYAATSRGITTNASDRYGVGLLQGGFTFAGTLGDPPANIWKFGSIYEAMRGRTPDPVRFTQWVHSRYGPLDTIGARNGAWYGLNIATAIANAPQLPNPICGNTDSPQANVTYINDYDPGQTTTSSYGFRRWLSVENDALLKAGGDRAALKPQCLNPVNFIDPEAFQDVNGEDDHPPGTPQQSQRFVWDVVDALMSAHEVWKRSVLFITWDEHGGFYDHVAPPPACPPDDITPAGRWSGAYGGGKDLDHTPWADENRTIPRTDPTSDKPPPDTTDSKYGGAFDRYGIRVPLIVVSPWAKHRGLSHRTYDHTSILHFVEARFGLPALTNRDANADPLFDLFDFSAAADKLRDELFGLESLPPRRAAPFADYSTLSASTTANDLCLEAFAPSAHPRIGGDLGSDPYGGYDWSPGKPPPCGYSAEGLWTPTKTSPDASCGGIYTLVDLGPAHGGKTDPFNVNDQTEAGEPGPIALHVNTVRDVAENSDDAAAIAPLILTGVGASSALAGVPGQPAQVAAINDARVAAGSFVFCHEQNDATTAAVWTLQPSGDPVLAPLGSLAAGYGTRARALGINAANHVVGVSLRPTGALGFYYHAFFFDGQMHDLGVLPTGSLSSARAVNVFDTVVGAADVGLTNHQHAALWTQGSMFDIHPTFACQSSYECGDIGCFEGECAAASILSSTAAAVDDADIIAGDYAAKIDSGDQRFHAFAATISVAGGPPPFRLPAAWERPAPPSDLPSYVPSSHASGAARDPSGRTIVVGNQNSSTPDPSGAVRTTAVRWTLSPERGTKKAKYRDAFAVENLNLLVIDRGQVFLDDAVGINASGDIVATGYVVDASGAPGPKHVYLLKQAQSAAPIQPPAPIQGRVLACLPNGFAAAGPVPPFDMGRGCGIDATDGTTISICGASGAVNPDGTFTATDATGLSIYGQLVLDEKTHMVKRAMQTVMYSYQGFTNQQLVLTPN